MTATNSTFAGQLKHFAQSVDIVDSTIFDQIRDLVCKYVTNELKGRYFELLREEYAGDGADRQLWLRTFWSSHEKMHTWSLRTDDGVYANAVCDVVANERPMWLVSPDRAPLDQADVQVDLWSGTQEVARYRPSYGEPIRTAIVVPLGFKHSAGAYCIESAQYFEATEVAKSELRRLGEALAILYGLWEFNRAQSSHTEHAIGDLRDLLDRARFPRLALPHMFLAFPAKADDSVKWAIKDVLRGFSDRLEYTDWEEMYQAGNVLTQIGSEIMESRFGICYLSEPIDGDELPTRYDDNCNVVFEAGMLHARTSATTETDTGEPAGWIPIREKNSPPPPFDFASERILVVPRSDDGQLNDALFREMLKRRIQALLRET